MIIFDLCILERGGLLVASFLGYQEKRLVHSCSLHVSACLSCSFSRLIEVVNVGQDLDLNGDYFLLLGRGETPGNYIGLI